MVGMRLGGKRKMVWIFSSLLVIVLLAIYALFDPRSSSFFPRCPSYWLTGYLCPGCGSQRALHSLLRLDIVGAMQYNVLLVLYLPYLAFGVYMEYLGGKQKRPVWYARFFGRTAILINFTIIVAYTLLRNIFPL